VTFSWTKRVTGGRSNVGRKGMYLAIRNCWSDVMPNGKSYVLDSFCCKDEDNFWVSALRIVFQYAKPRSSSVPSNKRARQSHIHIYVTYIHQCQTALKYIVNIETSIFRNFTSTVTKFAQWQRPPSTLRGWPPPWKFKKKNLNIFATDWPILTKFSTVMSLDILDPVSSKISQFNKSKITVITVLKIQKITIPSQSNDWF